MSKKCDKYEAYFTFSSEEDFNRHLEECEECREEHIKQNKVSMLVREVAPVFKKDAKRKRYALASCAMLLVISVCGVLTYNFETHSYSIAKYSVEDTTNYELGFPVDEYGLIKI